MGKSGEIVFSLAKHLSEWPAVGSCVLISSFCCSYSQVGRHQIFYELNKGTSVYCGAEGQGPLRQAIMYYNNKRNKKEVKETVSNVELELASLQHSQI